MRFLLDQDVYALTARFLRDLGHDVVTPLNSTWLAPPTAICWPARVKNAVFSLPVTKTSAGWSSWSI